MSPLDSHFDAHDLRTASTPDLLRLILGRTRARPWLNQPLADLFLLRPIQHPGCREPGRETPKAPAILLAAKELLARSLHEDLSRTSVVDKPDAARDLVRLHLAHLPHEVFAVALLDAQHGLLDFVVLFRGTLQQTSVYPREVAKLALDRHAAAVILAHNHPSGLGDPSQADLALTRTLKEALALIDVRVLDHFIVAGPRKPTSLAERGLL